MQETTTSRRAFCIQTAKIGGGLLLLQACNRAILPAADTTSSFSQFQQSFSGQIIQPNSPDYETAKHALVRHAQMNPHPALIARCTNARDVQQAVAYARTNNLEIAVRSGNHSFLAWGTCDNGMVIDLSGMKQITVDPIKQTALVQTGNTAAAMLAATAPHGLAPVLGQCGSVGAGFILGGGLGWLSGRHGAGCDNLLEAQIVTADGKLVTTNKNNHPDLYWAIRGGGGNFGIATSFTLQLHPVAEVMGGSLLYPISQARHILRAFRELMAQAPDDLQADCYLTKFNNAYSSIRVEIMYTGNNDQDRNMIADFIQANPPETNLVKRRELKEMYAMESGVEFPSCTSRAVKGALVHELSDDFFEVLLRQFAEAPEHCSMFFNLSHYMHGAVCRKPTSETAFSLRTPGTTHLVSLLQWSGEEQTAACLQWHERAITSLQQFSNGRIYANYMSISGTTTERMVFGTNLERLVQIKNQYDPTNLFHRNQNISPKINRLKRL